MFVVHGIPDPVVINHPDDLRRLLEGVDYVAIDTETDGTSIKSGYSALLDKIVCWSVATDKFRAFLPLELVFECDFLFSNPKIAKIFHNAKYDMHCFENLGVVVSGEIYDTIIMAWLLDTENKDYSLKYLSKHYLKIYKSKSFSEVFRDTEFLDDMELSVEYATFDAYITYLLFLALKERLEAIPWRNGKSLFSYYREIEQHFLKCLYRMERRGVRIDVERLKEIKKEIEGIVSKCVVTVSKLAGKPINLNSSQQVADFLFNSSGLPVTQKTSKTRAPSTSSKALRKLSTHPKFQEYVAPILEYRAYQKLLNSFVDPILEKIKLYDGKRLYSTFDLHGTETGRISSSKPNVMNIPKRHDKVGIRKAFVASPGYKLIVCDYSQAEIRVMAHLCGDTNMIEACKGGDFYTLTAKKIFGIRNLTDEQRSVIKALVLGLHYGSSAETIAAQLAEVGYNYTVQQIKNFVDSYFTLYPRFSYYYYHIKYTALDNDPPHLRSILGRPRHIRALKSDLAEGARQALNAGPQAGVADILRGAMIQIESNSQLKELGARLLLQIHDELVIEVPEESAELAEVLVRKIMSDPLSIFNISLSVPLDVESKIVDTWGD